MAKPKVINTNNTKENNNNINNRFNNKIYDITLQDTTKIACDDVVVKNAPFLVVVSSLPNVPSSRIPSDSQDIVVELVEADNVEQVIVCRTTTPCDHNIYLKEGSMTVEARIHVLSSKQEGSLFRVVVKFGSHSIISSPIRCVSKLDTKKKQSTTPVTTTNNININEQETSSTDNNNKNKRKQPEPTTTTSTTSPINNSNNNNQDRDLKKVKRQQKKDRELISLLYKQNVMLVNQINVLTSGLNKLISVHNDNLLSVPASPPYQLPSAYSPSSPCSSQSQQTAPQLCHLQSQLSSLPSSPEVVPCSSLDTASLSFPSINTDMLENLGLTMGPSDNQQPLQHQTTNPQLAPFDGNCSFGSFLVKCNGEGSSLKTSITNTSAIADTKHEDNQQQVIRMSDFIAMSNYQQLSSSACCTNNSNNDNTYSHSLLDLNLDFNNVEYSSSPLPSPNFNNNNDNVPSESDMIII